MRHSIEVERTRGELLHCNNHKYKARGERREANNSFAWGHHHRVLAHFIVFNKCFANIQSEEHTYMCGARVC